MKGYIIISNVLSIIALALIPYMMVHTFILRKSILQKELLYTIPVLSAMIFLHRVNMEFIAIYIPYAILAYLVISFLLKKRRYSMSPKPNEATLEYIKLHNIFYDEENSTLILDGNKKKIIADINRINKPDEAKWIKNILLLIVAIVSWGGMSYLFFLKDIFALF